MTNCKITIEITNYEPKNLPNIDFTDLICFFKSENIEESINLGDHFNQKINHILKNIRSDIKYNIRLKNQKSKTLIGICTFIIPIYKINKTNINSNFIFSKNCLLTMIESTKRTLFGSLSKERNFIIEINSKIQILSKGKTNSFFERTNSSLPTMPSLIKGKKSFCTNNINCYSSRSPYSTLGKNTIENDFDFISTPPKKYFNHKTIERGFYKNFHLINKSNSSTICYQNKKRSQNSLRRNCFENKKKKSRQIEQFNNKHIKSKSITYEGSHGSNDYTNSLNNIYDNNSMINLEKEFNIDDLQDNNFSDLSTNDQLLINNIENDDLNEKLDNEIFSAFNNFKINYSGFEKNNNFDNLNNIFQENLKNNICSLIEYYSLIMEKFSHLNKKKDKLLSIYNTNIEKVKYIKKKIKTLKVYQINSDVKKIKINLNNNLNNKIIKEKILINKNEYEIFKNILKNNYFEYKIKKNKENEILKEEEKKKLLLSSIQGSINLYGNISHIYNNDEDSKIRLKALLFRFDIKENEMIYNTFQISDNVIEMGNRNSSLGKLNIHKIKAIKEVDEDKEEDSESEDEDLIKEKKIDKLIEEFEKKKNRKIKFEKIAPFKYKYGSQNVDLNLDQNDQIYIKFYKGLFSLEKFTEVNERIEECKLKSNNFHILKSLNNSNEFKKNKKQKL